MNDSPHKRVAIIGGGISGLITARKMQVAGYDVDIYDAASRMGGKINTVQNGNAKADAGAEFIDSDQKALIDLAKELGVKLISAGNLSETFHTPSGRTLTDKEFYNEYLPIAKQTLRDKKEIAANPTGERAQALDGLSVAEYMQQLAASVPDNRPLWKKIVLFWQKPEVSDDIITIAQQTYCAEAGRSANQVSALQFVRESGDTPDTLIASDAALRVEGGTQTLIDALEKDIAAHGANFHTGAKLSEVSKSDGSFTMNFENGAQAQADQVVLATAAHHLPDIKGLEELGMPADDLQTLRDLQYTKNSKITVHVKDTPENRKLLEDECFFYSESYQKWARPGEGEMVFLVGGDMPDKHKPAELITHVLENYAQAHGKTVDEIFDVKAVNFQGSGGKAPCYASPGKGQVLKLEQLKESLGKLAEAQGLGIVGTFVPGKNGSIGFMDNGAQAAEDISDRMLKGAEMEKLQSLQRSPQQTQNWATAIATGRAQPPEAGIRR